MLNNEKNKFFQQCGCIKYNRPPAIDYTERSRKQLDSIGYLPKHRNGIPFPVGGKPLRGEAVQPLVQNQFLLHKSIAFAFGQQAAALIITLLL